MCFWFFFVCQSFLGGFLQRYSFAIVKDVSALLFLHFYFFLALHFCVCSGRSFLRLDGRATSGPPRERPRERPRGRARGHRRGRPKGHPRGCPSRCRQGLDLSQANLSKRTQDKMSKQKRIDKQYI